MNLLLEGSPLPFFGPMKHLSALLAPSNMRAMSRTATLLLVTLGGFLVAGRATAQNNNLATATQLYNFSTSPSASKLVEDSGGNFYGTQAPDGGLNQVYRFSPAGIFTSLYLFQGASGLGPQSLIMGTDGNLYGVATSGGTVNGGTGTGTVYRLTLTGDFTLLHTFDGVDDGVGPNNLVQGDDGNFYGTTVRGGKNVAVTFVRVTPAFEFISLYSFAL